ncbi:MAG: EamA family transporter [Deltaproteobacteria bacterium]|nr:EamA family transporter [Deltaproteobacteria bacterium]
MSLWFILALSCALFTASCDALSKRVMTEHDEWLTGTVLLGISVLFFSPIAASVQFKPVSFELLVVLGAALPLEILAYYLFLSAIRMGPLSLTVPLLAFTPVFTIVTSAVVVQERVSMTGAAGIVMVTVGAYILNGDRISRDVLAPVRAIFSNNGARRMLTVALIWSVTSSLGKKGILLYGAIPFGFVLVCGDLVIFLLICALRWSMGSGGITMNRRTIAFFILGGLLMAAAEVTHFLSMSMAPVSYMISVKRLSLVFGVLLGWIVFRERNIRYRLAGSAVMVGGVFLLYE